MHADNTYSGASWVRNLPKLSSKKLGVCDKTFNHRLGNLAAIDVMVQEMMQKLEDYGILNNTFVVYTTDNGMIGSSSVAVFPADVLRLPHRQPSTTAWQALSLRRRCQHPTLDQGTWCGEACQLHDHQQPHRQ